MATYAVVQQTATKTYSGDNLNTRESYKGGTLDSLTVRSSVRMGSNGVTEN